MYKCGLSKKKIYTNGRQNQTYQHKKTHVTTSRLHHWCVNIIGEKAKYGKK